jgi:hypothetical protein
VKKCDNESPEEFAARAGMKYTDGESFVNGRRRAASSTASADGDEPLPPAFSEQAIASRFAEAHEGDLRYVAPLGKWFSYTGSFWRADDTLRP